MVDGERFFHAGMFEHFHGSDHMNMTELIELILELLNNTYPIETLRDDIEGMWDDKYTIE